MNFLRLFHTTAIRLTLRNALLYALLVTLGLAILYWAITNYIDAQTTAGLEQELNQLVTIDRRAGRNKLIATLSDKSQIGLAEDQQYFLLQSANGEKLAGNLEGWPSSVKPDGKVRNIWVEDSLIPDRPADSDGYWPLVATRLDDGSLLLIALNVAEAEDLLEFILGAMGLILMISIAFALTTGWLLGRTLLSRIDTVNQTAQQVSDGDFSRRVPLSGHDDEFDELAGHLNAMLSRIDKLLTGMRQVTDNIAHDLRQPLTRIRNRIEVTLMTERSNSEYRQALQESLADTTALMETFTALLEISQAEAGSFRGEWGSVDLSDMLESLGELYQDESEAQHKHFELHVEPGLTVTGNRHLLAQATSNLLDNALKYAPDGSTIQLQASQDKHRSVSVSVSDNGPGIPENQRANVFDRFYRLETDRSTPGNGLGLSLVKAVANLHQAKLTLEDNAPGLRVTLVLAGPDPARK